MVSRIIRWWRRWRARETAEDARRAEFVEQLRREADEGKPPLDSDEGPQQGGGG